MTPLTVHCACLSPFRPRPKLSPHLQNLPWPYPSWLQHFAILPLCAGSRIIVDPTSKSHPREREVGVDACWPQVSQQPQAATSGSHIPTQNTSAGNCLFLLCLFWSFLIDTFITRPPGRLGDKWFTHGHICVQMCSEIRVQTMVPYPSGEVTQLMLTPIPKVA